MCHARIPLLEGAQKLIAVPKLILPVNYIQQQQLSNQLLQILIYH